MTKEEYNARRVALFMQDTCETNKPKAMNKKNESKKNKMMKKTEIKQKLVMKLHS
jgi:hypothetical protein